MALAGTAGALVEVNAETDFVARNESFQELVRRIAALAPAAKGDLDGAEGGAGRGHRPHGRRGDHPGDRGDRREHQPAPHGLSRGAAGRGRRLPAQPARARASASSACWWRWRRRATPARRGRDRQAAGDARRRHQPAGGERRQGRPRAWSSASGRSSPTRPAPRGKPENIIEKMVEGRLRKFYEEAVLLEQVFVVDTDKRVKEAVQAAAKELGAPDRGRGLRPPGAGRGRREGRRDDFAAEVAQLAGV